MPIKEEQLKDLEQRVSGIEKGISELKECLARLEAIIRRKDLSRKEDLTKEREKGD